MKLDIKKTYELLKEFIDTLDGDYHTITCDYNGEVYVWTQTPHLIDNEEWCGGCEPPRYHHIASIVIDCENCKECIYQFREPITTYQVPADRLCNVKDFIDSLPKQFLDAIDIISIEKDINVSYGVEFINNTPYKTGIQCEYNGYFMQFRWKSEKNLTKIVKYKFEIGDKYRINVAKQTITKD